MKTIIDIHCIEGDGKVQFYFEDRKIFPWLTEDEIEQLKKMFPSETLGAWRIEL